MSIQYFLNALVLMKTSHSGIAFVLRSGKAVLCFILAHIHYDHALGFKAWKQCMLASVVEDAAVNVVIKVIKRKQHLFIQSTNDVGSPFTLPVVAIDTRLTYQCIATRANSFSLKAALVHINNGIALLCKAFQLNLISRSCYRIRFWML